jgi:hypothetical protein
MASASRVVRRSERRYRQGTLVLETDFETEDGMVRLVDCMGLGNDQPNLVRVVEGVRGCVAMQMRFVPRFYYGRLIPSLGRIDWGVFAVAGPTSSGIPPTYLLQSRWMRSV